MDFLTKVPEYAIPFLVVLSVLVFVHELGHYLAARWCGVRVEVFSIGFGRELFGFKDAHGTRWKFCLIPLGGYVQMYGEGDPSSDTIIEDMDKLGPRQKKESFFFKPVWQRAAIVFAGPAINFIYAIVLLTGIFAYQGQVYAPAEVGGFIEESVGHKAGFEIGDRVVSINGSPAETFQDIQRAVTINLGNDMVFVVQRGENELTITAAPEVFEQEDNFGFKHKMGRLGILSVGKVAIKEHDIASAFVAALVETESMVTSTMKALGQMIVGVRSAEELGGVIRIGAYAKQFSDAGIVSLLMFSAIISVNLGLINLFPIPILDGGRLVFYAYEAVFRKPMPDRVFSIAMRAGYAFVIVLMIFATMNDLIQLKFFKYISKLVS